MYPHERSLVQTMQGRPFSLLGVNNDEELDTVKTAVKENELNWRSWWDGGDGPIVKDFGIESFPTIFLVDHTGVIRYKNLRGAALDMAIELLVSEAESAGAKGGIVLAEPELRQFVDKTGNHKVVAKFKSFTGINVIVEKSSGEEITLVLDSLSQKDRDYLEESGYLAAAEASSTASLADGSTEAIVAREFTDSTGNYRVTATFVKLDGNDVTLRKDDGSEVVLPLDRLSETDQQYVKKAGDNPKR